jgi:hypothetical protein
MSEQSTEKYETIKEFWPYYLSEHANGTNRLLHFVGSCIGLAFALAAIVYLEPLYLLPALVSGYAFAWIGHFVIEKNRPATFTYPFKSFACDWIMWWYTLTGQIADEMKRLGIENK